MSWRSAAKAATKPDEDAQPDPPRRRQKDGTDTGSFRIVARNIALRVRNSGRDLAGKLAAAFTTTKAAITATVDNWFAEFFEDGAPAPLNVLDPASPDFNLGIGSADQGSAFEATYEPTGPMLDLG